MTDCTVLRIGRSADNDIVIDDQRISRQHALLRKDQGRLWIEDLNSTNHTFVDGKPVQRASIRVGQDVRFAGQINLDWSSYAVVGWLQATSTGLAEQHSTPKDLTREATSFSTGWDFDLDSLGKSEVLVGRGDECELRLAHPRVSRHHALITRREDKLWWIRDLGSTNGTFVDGKRITECRVTPTARISIAGLEIRLFCPASDKPGIRARKRGEAAIELKGVGFAVRDGIRSKSLLKNITLSIDPGDFVGLVGPSGSGKTTLMMLINGYNNPSVGSIRINGIELGENKDQFKGFIGYVPQDDIIHRGLKVGGSLRYNAKLRLPDSSSAEREQEVVRVVDELGLRESLGVMIGTAEKKGISGGQRKRVNLAQELITQPSLLILDEPCSGLDPHTDNEVMKLLRKLSDNGKTIILTTHNITQRNFAILDKLIVLAEGGNLAYYGPPSEAVTYFGVNDAEEIFEALKKKPGAEWRSRFEISGFHSKGAQPSACPAAPAGGAGGAKSTAGSQITTLFRRNSEIKLRDRIQTLLLIAQAPIIGILTTVALRNHEARESMFAFTLALASVWLGLSNAARDVVSEKDIVRRERKVFLGMGSYLASKMLVLLLLNITQCTILLLITQSAWNVSGSFAMNLTILTITASVGTAMGLFISSLVNTEASAMAITPIILVPQLIFGGVVTDVFHMDIPGVISWVIVVRWAYSSLFHLNGFFSQFEPTEGMPVAAGMLVILFVLFTVMAYIRLDRSK